MSSVTYVERDVLALDTLYDEGEYWAAVFGGQVYRIEREAILSETVLLCEVADEDMWTIEFDDDLCLIHTSGTVIMDLYFWAGAYIPHPFKDVVFMGTDFVIITNDVDGTPLPSCSFPPDEIDHTVILTSGRRQTYEIKPGTGRIEITGPEKILLRINTIHLKSITQKS
ncbi:MAG: hypothetical protein UY34_C0041G0010 [Parcubacteria group bacterium GW2011_GWA2_48_9]|nr:MAG: hypothetical protein UY34_C0041G0010 [Parcubacteria group bacterium GW2011_GWA2_48_9]